MILVTQNNDIYTITSPYDRDLIELIKTVPGRKWVPEQKLWTIPADKLGWFMKAIRGTRFEQITQYRSTEDLNVNAEIDATEAIPDFDISKIKFHVEDGFKPYEHQLDFLRYALHRQQTNMSGFVVGDEPGLGKTIESTNLAIVNQKQHKFKHCLIICCINSCKFNWLRDIKKHTNGKYEPYILGTRLKRDGRLNFETGSKEKLEDIITGHMYGKKDQPKLPYFLIVNIEAVRMKSGRTYPISDAIIKMINDGNLNMIIMDEVHKNVSPKSLQGKQILRIKKSTGRKCMWLPMTGTPIIKKPTDVFLPLKLIDSHNYSSFYTWCNYFCVYGGYGGHDIIGYKNIPELKNMLQSNMIRRKKDDVLDLPPKVYFTDYVENTPYQQKLYNEIEMRMREEKDDIVGSINPLAKFMRLRQVNGSPELIDPSLVLDKDYPKKNAKFLKLLERTEECLDRGEKVVIFSNWVEPLRTIYKYFFPMFKKLAVLTGTIKAEERERQKDIFNGDPECRIMLGTCGAMGVSHTLTAANNVIFYDEPWNPGEKTQCNDRVHRISTTKFVNIYTIITQNTVDDRVHDILYCKEGISNYIVDNIDIRNNPRLFDLLLSR